MSFENDGSVETIIAGQKISCTPGTPLADLLPSRTDAKGRRYLGAITNNRLVGLYAPIWTPSVISLVTVADNHGAAIYRRCATYLLCAAFHDLYPALRLEIGQSMGNGYHFRVIGDQRAPLDLHRISEQMQLMVSQDTPFNHHILSVEQACQNFEQLGCLDKVRLLRAWPSATVNIVSIGNFADVDQGPVALSAGSVDDFKLIPKEPGFVLHFSSLRSPVWRGEPWSASDKIFETYQETRSWNEILGVNTVGDLNELCLNGGVRDIIRIAEGFHEKKIANIADRITARQPRARLILIAGPSSSGKTTFSKRLTIQLRVNGINPLTLSLDNYYVDRADTPRHPDGTYDFEAIEAIDLDLFNEQLADLLAGKRVLTPSFDFSLGVRAPKAKWRPLQLHDDQILMLEGIHGLNDRLTKMIPNEEKFRIFVSALTQLIIDSANRVATSDARLIRRIVRDRRYRGYSAAQTISTWTSVRHGERRNIFPFQDKCDVMFNSALVYEPAVLKVLAERYLLEVPRDHPSAVMAHGLRKFLQLFVPIFPDDVPRGSILREFIGGSFFRY